MVIAARIDAFLQLLLRGDRRRVMEAVDTALASGLPIEEIQEDLIGEAQRRIGALWERNQIGVADEHMATAISRQALAHLHEAGFPAMLKDERVLVACVEGEMHELPAKMVADLLELAGYDVRFLGADVPTRSLPGIIARFRPDVLALSVTTPANLRNLLPAARESLARAPSLLVAAGGRAVNVVGQLPRLKGAELVTASDARALARLVDRRFGYVPSFREAAPGA
jgi:methanogenic corrinoid protein MtbC1